MTKMSRKIGAFVLCAAIQLAVNAYAAEVTAGNDPVYQEDVYKAELSRNIGKGKKVYFAAPMFSQADKDYNLQIVKILEDYGYEVFLPQRNGIEAVKLEGKSEEELTKMIFDLDAGEVKKADIVFMNIDGRVPDEGAAVELGLAYAYGKRCYGFKTDAHSVEFGLDINPMISGCMLKLFRNNDGDKLQEELKQYLSHNLL